MDEAETSDGFSEWEQIQAPRSPTHSTPPMTPSREQYMVVVTTQDNNLQHQADLSVYSPSHRHEGLEIVSDDEPEVNSSVASRSSSTTGDEANSGRLKKANEIGKILRNGIVNFAARVRYYMDMDFGWGVWSVGAVCGFVAAVLTSFVYAKVRKSRARVLNEEKKDRLIFLIQEKDQKINKLFVQIAHMNELLSARRRVPVLRIS
ncbi:hypothetical protein REPUB_Repub04eG0247800 [Reevesia pubescens]